MKWKLAILFLLMSSIAFAEEVTLTWDHTTDKPDGYRIYQKTNKKGDNFDFSNPVKTNLYPDGKIPPNVNSCTVEVPGIEGAVLKYFWVIKAVHGETESQESNEIVYEVVNVPPITPIELSGGYDKDHGRISLTWQQPQDDYSIYKWIVYYRKESGKLTKLGTVHYNRDLKFTGSFDALLSGESGKVYLSVVAFRRSGVGSKKSNELMVEIDRRRINHKKKLQISIDIPVK